MSNPVHPGPWSNRNGFVNDAKGRLVARVPDKQAARLVATAPELLGVLESLLAWGRDNSSPNDPNGPYWLLVDAANVVKRAVDG